MEYEPTLRRALDVTSRHSLQGGSKLPLEKVMDLTFEGPGRGDESPFPSLPSDPDLGADMDYHGTGAASDDEVGQNLPNLLLSPTPLQDFLLSPVPYLASGPFRVTLNPSEETALASGLWDEVKTPTLPLPFGDASQVLRRGTRLMHEAFMHYVSASRHLSEDLVRTRSDRASESKQLQWKLAQAQEGQRVAEASLAALEASSAAAKSLADRTGQNDTATITRLQRDLASAEGKLKNAAYLAELVEDSPASIILENNAGRAAVEWAMSQIRGGVSCNDVLPLYESLCTGPAEKVADPAPAGSSRPSLNGRRSENA